MSNDLIAEMHLNGNKLNLAYITIEENSMLSAAFYAWTNVIIIDIKVFLRI